MIIIKKKQDDKYKYKIISKKHIQQTNKDDKEKKNIDKLYYNIIDEEINILDTITKINDKINKRGHNYKIEKNTIKAIIFMDKVNNKILNLNRLLGLKSIILGDSFNDSIYGIHVLKELKSLKIGNKFNQELPMIEGLHALKLGNAFNNPLPLLPALRSLIIGNNFNQDISILEHYKNLRLFKIGGTLFKQSINMQHFPIVILILGNRISTTINKLPDSLKIFKIANSAYCSLTFGFPQHLQYMKLNDNIQRHINLYTIPQSIRTIIYGPSLYGIMPEIPASLIHIKLPSNYTAQLPPLPPNLKTFISPHEYNKFLGNIPESLTTLKLGYFYSQKINKLPPCLTTLILDDEFRWEIPYLPESLLYIKLGSIYDRQLPRLPPRLRYLTFNKSLSPDNVHPAISMKMLEFYKMTYENDIKKKAKDKINSLVDGDVSSINKIVANSIYAYNYKFLNIPNTIEMLITCSPNVFYELPPSVHTVILINFYPLKQEICNIKGAMYVDNIFIHENYIDKSKYNNEIFMIPYNEKGYVLIKRNLAPFIKYMIKNPVFIPYEIYNHIITKFNFSY